MTPMGSAPARPAASRAGGAVRKGLCWLKTLLVRGRLDAALAGGADPERDPALTLRAKQLLRARYRRRLAASVQHLVDDLESDPGSYLSSALPFELEEVARARQTLLSLADALRYADPVHARGIALTLRLITDPLSPLYVRTTKGELQLQAQTALNYILADSQPWCELR